MVTVRPMEERERSEVYNILIASYEGAYGIDRFLSYPSVFIVAENSSGEIAGVLGITRGMEGELLPTEVLLGGELGSVIGHYIPQRSLICEFERFAVDHSRGGSETFVALIAGMVFYAHSIGIKYILTVTKPKLRDFVKKRLGVATIEIERRLLLDRVPSPYDGFFKAEPGPVAAAFIVDDALLAKMRNLHAVSESSAIAFATV
jgi:hypothetical protein